MTEPTRALLSLLTPGRSPSEGLRNTPPLLDELRAIQELIERPETSREGFACQVQTFALDVAREHHRQQVEEYAFEFEQRRRNARQAGVVRWLEIALACAIVVLLIVAVAAIAVAVAAGDVDPLDLLPPRPFC